jgi:hypothetical protein
MKLKYFIYSTLLILLFSSCKEDIIVVKDQKETAVIYGILDPSESIHYIKITRAINGTANALEEAKNETINYFEKVDASVFEIINGDTLGRWKLRDTIISGRSPGLYYGPTQKVYYFTTTNKPLKDEAGVFYHFQAKLNNKYTVSAITDLVRDVSITNPSYQFATTNVGKDGYAQTSFNVFSGTATIVNTNLNLLIQQKFSNNTTRIDTLAWKISEESVPSGKLVLTSINGEDFYKLIKNGLKNQSDVIQRKLIGIDLITTFGSSTLEKYIALNKPSSSLAQTKPNFTNITSKDDIRIYGIFTSTTTKRNSRTSQNSIRIIDVYSSKELCTGTITNGLNFCTDDAYHNKTSFYCGN